jgi:hypothetical protein
VTFLATPLVRTDGACPEKEISAKTQHENPIDQLPVTKFLNTAADSAGALICYTETTVSSRAGNCSRQVASDILPATAQTLPIAADRVHVRFRYKWMNHQHIRSF